MSAASFLTKEIKALQGSIINGRIDAAATGPCWPLACGRKPAPLLPEGNRGTFTIITGDSSGVSADIHDRMPIWLQAGQIDDWMAASTDDAMAMLLSSETPAMEAYRVRRAVNTPRNNSEGLLEPIA